MNVLLISPKDPKKPSQLKFLMGGESTYTHSLLDNPPKGVSYTYFSDALKNNEIEYTPWQTFLNTLIKTRILPIDAGYQCLRLKKRFDLVHCHGYCLKLAGNIKPPVVLSDSSSNYLFLKDYLGWSREKINSRYTLRKFLAQKLHIFDPNLNLNGAPLIVWSEFAKKTHLDLGIDRKKVIVIPPGIAKFQLRKTRNNLCTILFVGTWFKRKGGEILLTAYKELKKKYPNVDLILIGEIEKDIFLSGKIFHKNYVPREKLIRDIFPKADILVDVPPVAEGYGLVVLEAASLGIPAIVSSVYALPEIVEDRKTGFVIGPNNVSALVDALEKLIKNPTLLEKMGRSAKKRFIKNYWGEVTNKKLLKVYKEAFQNP